MFSIVLKYPSFQEEIQIIKSSNTISNVNINPILTVDEIIQYQDLIRRMPVTDNVLEYIVNLVTKTRPTKNNSDSDNKYIEWGAGPRASQYLLIASKCNAAINGKYSPDIEDVREVAVSVLRHRVLKNYKAEAENLSIEQIINNLF